MVRWLEKHHLSHALIALVMQAIIGLATGNWWAGAALGSGFYLGREHNQYEIRKRLLEPLFPIKAILDIAVPVVATVSLAAIKWSIT
jgi:hypothetical protein